MVAFVRFQENTDGVWTATIAPNYDVLLLIATHFRTRYADMERVIADAHGHYGLHHRAGKLLPRQFVHHAGPTLCAPRVAPAAH